MSFDIGRFVQNTSAMGATYFRDARRERGNIVAIVLREPGPDVDVSPDVWSALVAYHTGIDYPGKPSLVGDDGAVRFYGLHGLLCVRELESLPAGTIRSMGTREAVPGTRCEYCQVAVSQ